MNTTISPAAELANLKARERQLWELEDLCHPTYYDVRKVFTHDLNVFINQLDWSGLSGKEMLSLCSLVSVYRPMAPHSFLSRCSQLSAGV